MIPQSANTAIDKLRHIKSALSEFHPTLEMSESNIIQLRLDAFLVRYSRSLGGLDMFALYHADGRDTRPLSLMPERTIISFLRGTTLSITFEVSPLTDQQKTAIKRRLSK